MNSDGNRLNARPQPPRLTGMRPPDVQGQQGTAGPSRPSAGGTRGFRNRPQYSRYGSSSQEAAASRQNIRDTEVEPNPVNETALERLKNFHKEEQTIRNDLALRYATSGEWGGNHIKGVEPDERCIEYPKLRHLMALKQEQSSKYAHPALHMAFDPANDSLMSLTSHLPIPFDVILIDPPPSYDWSKITSIPIRLISADPSFVFLWVGDAAGDGLEKGREALLKWGFRRCEEILWVKPNQKAIKAKQGTEDGQSAESDVQQWMSQGRKDQGDRPRNIMVTQKEHCLVGIRGTVRRKTDNWFVHCNVDTDVMVWEREEDDETSPRFPPQLYDIIENFCLGTRRLELFGPKSKARKGWVTIGEDDLDGQTDVKDTFNAVQDYAPEKYDGFLQNLTDHLGRNVLPQVDDIEAIRPKSPTRGDRPGSMTGPSTPHLRPRPGGPPNRPEMGGFDNRQGSFRPTPRTQFPPRPVFSQHGNNPQWTNAPPRMQAFYAGRDSGYPAFGMAEMQGALNTIDHGYPDDSGRLHQEIPPQSWHGLPQSFPTHDFQPYTGHMPHQPRPMPRFQQYPSTIDNMNRISPIGRPLPPQYSDQQYYPPSFVQQHNQHLHSNGPSFAHHNGPSFMPAGNGQYYANDYANDPGMARPLEGYRAPAPRAPHLGNQNSYQHWGS